MYTTYSNEGTLNNYAVEPEVYYAVEPSPEQQRTYLKQGACALLLVSSLIMTSFIIS